MYFGLPKILQLILFFLEKFQPASCYSIQFCRYLGQKIAILHIFLIVQLSTADLCKTLLIFEIVKINRFPFPALFEPLYFLKLCPILDELKFLGIMLNLGQKSYFLRPTIFKIPQPNWYCYTKTDFICIEKRRPVFLNVLSTYFNCVIFVPNWMFELKPSDSIKQCPISWMAKAPWYS